MKYEYQTVGWYVNEPLTGINSMLNDEGKQGWELVSTNTFSYRSPTDLVILCVFKRPLPETKKP